jgi:hypothetical protein
LIYFSINSCNRNNYLFVHFTYTDTDTHIHIVMTTVAEAFAHRESILQDRVESLQRVIIKMREEGCTLDNSEKLQSVQLDYQIYSRQLERVIYMINNDYMDPDDKEQKPVESFCDFLERMRILKQSRTPSPNP